MPVCCFFLLRNNHLFQFYGLILQISNFVKIEKNETDQYLRTLEALFSCWLACDLGLLKINENIILINWPNLRTSWEFSIIQFE